MKRGILYLATGSPSYVHDAAVSIASMRESGYKGHISLISDVPQAQNLKPMNVSIIRCNKIDTGLQSRKIKTSLNKFTPYDTTLFLDVDTIAARQLKPIWDQVDEHDIALAIDARRTCKSQAFGLEKELRYTKKMCPLDFPHHNSGVMLWKKNEKTDKLFENWGKEWRMFKNRDQAALMRAIFQTDIELNTMDSIFNHFGEWGRLSKVREKGVVIWHACGRLGPYKGDFPEAFKKGSTLFSRS